MCHVGLSTYPYERHIGVHFCLDAQHLTVDCPPRQKINVGCAAEGTGGRVEPFKEAELSDEMLHLGCIAGMAEHAVVGVGCKLGVAGG